MLVNIQSKLPLLPNISCSEVSHKNINRENLENVTFDLQTMRSMVDANNLALDILSFVKRSKGSKVRFILDCFECAQ